MPGKFDKLAAQAANMTDDEFKNEFTTLTKFTNIDLDNLIKSTGISHKDLAILLREVKEAADQNESTAKAIEKIAKGTSALIEIARKIL